MNEWIFYFSKVICFYYQTYISLLIFYLYILIFFLYILFIYIELHRYHHSHTETHFSTMRRQPKNRPLLTAVFFLILCGFAYGRFISDQSDLISDGVHTSKVPHFLRLLAAEETCEQTYGFLPCTSTALGNLFLILVYGYLMFLAATYLSTGSELLLEILGPGIVGGLFLPILGALPDAMLILGNSIF